MGREGSSQGLGPGPDPGGQGLLQMPSGHKESAGRPPPPRRTCLPGYSMKGHLTPGLQYLQLTSVTLHSTWTT